MANLADIGESSTLAAINAAIILAIYPADIGILKIKTHVNR